MRRHTGRAKDTDAHTHYVRQLYKMPYIASAAIRQYVVMLSLHKNLMSLHITNGDVFAGALASAGITGDILPWRDVLHEGPVPSDASPEHFYHTRAQFIAGCGWASYDEVRAMFAERERVLAQADSHDEIILWFDPDLYDQLQLVQVLSRLSRMTLSQVTVSLVATDRPGIHDAKEIRSLFAQRTPVTAAQYELAQRTWQAVTASSPDGLPGIINDESIAVLPWLGAALHRYIEEFPAESDGLSRTERGILHCASTQPSLLDAFAALQHSEEHPFLGDTVFAAYVQQFTTAPYPLLEPEQEAAFRPLTSTDGAFWHQQLRLTDTGRKVLQRQASNIALNGVDRHIGGVHLHNGKPLWYRNASGQLVEK